MLAPHIDGTLAIRSPAADFLRAFRDRVAAGLLLGRPHPRSNYVVVETTPDRIRIQAADWWTAVNVIGEGGRRAQKMLKSGAGHSGAEWPRALLA